MTLTYSSLILLLATLAFPHPKPNRQTKAMAFTHATIIDGTGAEAMLDMTLIVRAGRIVALGKTGKVPIPRDAQVVDSSGKFLIPGLWDMHVHTSYQSFLALFLANGITGVRDMGGSPREFELLREWERQIKDGKLMGPRIVAAGTHVDGPAPIGRPNSINVATATEARDAVKSLKQAGADFIKVYSMLPREAYFAIADEAKREKLSFAGHVPAAVSVVEASDALQKSMEHLFGILAACSTHEEELRREGNAAVEKLGIKIFVQAEIRAQLKALESYDEKRAAALFARFIKNDNWQVPTLVGWQTLAIDDDNYFAKDARLKYIPLERSERWKVQQPRFIASLGSEYLANRKRLFEKQLELVGTMHRAGVLFMAGTDAAAPYVYPGFSLHDELALFVRAGLTPMEALQTATRNPAKFLGLLDSLGTIEEGKIANLVLLEADPLADIGNTKRIAAVVIDGQLVTKESLHKMLTAAQSAAAGSRENN